MTENFDRTHGSLKTAEDFADAVACPSTKMVINVLTKIMMEMGIDIDHMTVACACMFAQSMAIKKEVTDEVFIEICDLLRVNSEEAIALAKIQMGVADPLKNNEKKEGGEGV